MNKIAIVIPCYRVGDSILSLLSRIGDEVHKVYVVDDHCPLGTGGIVQKECCDPRVTVICHSVNEGVGGAVIAGYMRAFEDQMSIVVKLDGDGQMPPEFIPFLVEPIEKGVADYTKGNRFYKIDTLSGMPFIRIFGNSVLSFVNKFSSGYWNIMDPTNGFTALHCSLIPHLSLEKVQRRYFFESDMLFRLNTLNAVVKEVPMMSVYAHEQSHLNIWHTIRTFPPLYATCFFKRLFYNYFLRNFNAASVLLVIGCLLSLFGVLFGGVTWFYSWEHQLSTPTGTIMLAAVPTLLGFQCLLAFLILDCLSLPKEPVQNRLPRSIPATYLLDAMRDRRTVGQSYRSI